MRTGPKQKWTIKTVGFFAKKCASKAEFEKRFRNAHSAAYRLKIIDIVGSHFVRPTIVYKRIPIENRFWPRVKKTKTCWEWQGKISSYGYGTLTENGKYVQAHRIAWRLARGPIPDGLVLDHKCRNRKCVNPKHLRAVTWTVNALENSESICAKNLAKTHCKNGHPYVESNLVKFEMRRGHRVCIICRRKYDKEYKKNVSKKAKGLRRNK